MTPAGLIVGSVEGTRILFATDYRRIALLFPRGSNLHTDGLAHADRRGTGAMTVVWAFELRGVNQ